MCESAKHDHKATKLRETIIHTSLPHKVTAINRSLPHVGNNTTPANMFPNQITTPYKWLTKSMLQIDKSLVL